jgi:hypothetical protein
MSSIGRRDYDDDEFDDDYAPAASAPLLMESQSTVRLNRGSVQMNTRPNMTTSSSAPSFVPAGMAGMLQDIEDNPHVVESHLDPDPPEPEQVGYASASLSETLPS